MFKFNTNNSGQMQFSDGAGVKAVNFREKLHELIKGIDMPLSVLAELTGCDDFADFINDLNTFQSLTTDVNMQIDMQDILNLFLMFGVKVNYGAGSVWLTNVSIKEQAEAIINSSYAEWVIDIKLILIFEKKYDTAKLIPWDAEDQKHPVMVLEDLANCSTYVKFEALELKMRD